MSQTYSLINTDHSDKATEMAAKIVGKISSSGSAQLRAFNFEIRRPESSAASTWHQDKGPKSLVGLATLKGSPTEFVSPEVAQKKFGEPTSSGSMSIQHPELKPGEVQQADKDQFLFLVGKGVTAEDVPKLVHWAPGEEGREIFIARWAPKRPF